MCSNFKLFDHVQLNSRLHTNFACEYSEDGKIFILSESGVYVLTLKGNMDNTFPRVAFKKDLIKLSNTNICEAMDVDLDSFIDDISQEQLYETVLDVGLAGNSLNNTTQVNAKPVYAMWSPRGIIDKTDGVLAVLTNLHNIEIFVEVIDETDITSYIKVANLSRDIFEHYKRSWKKIEAVDAESKLIEYKGRVDLVTPTSFTWSHVILKDQKACCILFVGHKDGAVSAWRFVERKANDTYDSKLEFLERYNTELSYITALHWFCRKSDAGGLSVGDIDGRVCALSVSKLSTDTIIFSDEVVFNDKPDLRVDKITIVNYLNVTYLIGVKLNYLFIYAINEVGEVFEGKYIKVGNLYITGVLHYDKNTLLVLSICGQLKQIELSLVDNQISFIEKTIQLNLDTAKYRTHGFLFSPNKAFMGILTYPCRLKDVSKGKAFVNFFIFENTTKNPFQTLMNITSNSIRDYWDCLETLRVKCLQEKQFPWHGIDPKIHYDTLPILKFKILRWIAKLSESVYSIVPYVREYNIKAYVLLNYALDIKLAVQRMTKLLNIYFSEKKLSLFQMQNLDVLNFFLKETVVKDILTKANLGETFVDEMYDVMRIANELQYPPMPQCIWCGEKIIGSSCIPDHPQSRCAISLMPICITPGYKCPFCKCVVCKEMDQEYFPIFCPYCDVPMKRRFCEKKYKKGAEDSSDISTDEIVLSECYSDCLSEQLSLDSLEDNTTDYIVLTDSEDEDISAIYAKLKITVSTGVNFDEEKTDTVSNLPGRTDGSVAGDTAVSEFEEDESMEDGNYEEEDDD